MTSCPRHLTPVSPESELFSRLRVLRARQRRDANRSFALLALDLPVARGEGERRLQECVRGADLLALHGGRYFVLIDDLSRTQAPTTSLKVAHRLLKALAGLQTTGAPSCVGIASGSGNYASVEGIIREAERAIPTHLGTNASRADRIVFAAASNPDHIRAVERLSLERDLRAAIAGRELRLQYQPVVDVSQGRPTLAWVEALARWYHPRRGHVSPGEFVPLAESTGLAEPLGMWALEESLSQLQEWDHQGMGVPGVSINLSRRELSSGTVSRAKAALERFAITPDRVRMELTESAAIAGPELFEQVLAGLNNIGLRIALDDFGTGWSSLACLHQLPLHCVKLDRHFILGGTGEQATPRGRTVLHSMVKLINDLGLEIVAEGVECHAVVDEVARMGVSLVQGYVYARPMPPAELPGWINDHCNLRMAA
jgi:EAL domain-containing protein (putative c-di-GMP-specific phosphodiesterase class I)